jgi:electron transport complex protein RnfC
MVSHGHKTFGKGGIHPGSHKELTSEKPIEPITPYPKEVRLPLVEAFGAIAEMVVKKGDVVQRGQKIADRGPNGVPIHATISGKMKVPAKHPHPTLVTAQTMVIEAGENGVDDLEFPEVPGWRECPRDEALDRIREAGVVGLGGAAFPTYRKLMLPEGVTVDTLIINGAECEPYLTSDYRTMLKRPDDLVEGALIMARILGIKKVLIGIEDDKTTAIEPLETAIAEAQCGGIQVEVVLCEVRYPQGAERQLVTALTKRVVPARALPSAVGVVVQNVATAVAVYEAIRYQKPLLDRVVTVTGPGINEPKNVLVPVGTLLSELIQFCGGMKEDTTRVIAGGPMMGRALPRLDLPVIKGLNGLLLLTGHGVFEKGYGPCIQCGRCIDACPLGLEPDQVSLRVEAGLTLDTEPYGGLDCYECGCCTYVCPSERPLLQFMQVAKSALRRAEDLRIAT